ncbi:MAG: hypothetical protein WB535_07615 [Paenarthrobacter sp.]
MRTKKMRAVTMGLTGASVAIIAAALASGGLALVFASYGIAGISVLGSCYDDQGRPVF